MSISKSPDSVRYTVNKSALCQDNCTVSIDKLIALIHANDWFVDYEPCVDYFFMKIYGNHDGKKDTYDSYLVSMEKDQVIKTQRQLKILELNQN